MTFKKLEYDDQPFRPRPARRGKNVGQDRDQPLGFYCVSI